MSNIVNLQIVDKNRLNHEIGRKIASILEIEGQKRPNLENCDYFLT